MKRTLALGVVVVLVAACGGESAGEQPAAPPTQDGSPMRLTSTAFGDGDRIPTRYTCDGEDVSPPLRIEGVPDGAGALVLVMDDPDAPGGTWDHWIAYDLPVGDEIVEDVGSLGTGGRNSWGRTGYGGPCPPGGTHRYVFAVYALGGPLGLAEGASKADVYEAMGDGVLAEATLTGLYGR